MRILVVNPNTTSSMTATIGRAAQAAAAPGTVVEAVNPADGPASIEGYFDEAYSVPGLLAEIRKGEAAGFDGYMIACFDDTGLDAARSLASGPVIGIGEAAFHCASLIAGRFSVITTLSRSMPAIEHNLARYGLAARCARVRASEVPVLALEDATERCARLRFRRRSRLPSGMIAARRSSSAAPAWRISSPSCRSAMPPGARRRRLRGEAPGSPHRPGPANLENRRLCLPAPKPYAGRFAGDGP